MAFLIVSQKKFTVAMIYKCKGTNIINSVQLFLKYRPLGVTMYKMIVWSVLAVCRRTVQQNCGFYFIGVQFIISILCGNNF